MCLFRRKRNNNKTDDAFYVSNEKINATVHDGILCIDDLISLNDFDLYEEMLQKYPISSYETLFKCIKEKNYKAIFEWAIEQQSKQEHYEVASKKCQPLTAIIEDLREGITDNLRINIAHCLYAELWHESGLLNYKYLIKFMPVRSTCSTNTCFHFSKITYDLIFQAKNHLFLTDVLNNDVRFIKKACKSASQKELDDALTKISPNYFEGLDVLLDAGAKKHVFYIENQGDESEQNVDQIDKIGTEVLRQQIKDILRGKR